jgi:hypothetical protein
VYNQQDASATGGTRRAESFIPPCQSADTITMRLRRKEDRSLCAELLEITWKDEQGLVKHAAASLEDISTRGLCLGIEGPLPLGTLLTIYYPNGKYEGRVRYCHSDPAGFLVGVQFEPGHRWSRHDFRPSHLVQFRLRAAGKTPQDC